MAIPNPNPNIADGIKSDNKTYSSNKIESLISAATELPTPEEGDAGKVLAVNSDEDGYELTSIVNFTKKNYTATLASNEGVTPYASYVLIQIGADIEAYGPVAAVVINSTQYDQIITYGLNPDNGDLRVYGTKTGDVTVTVIYADITTAT